MGAIDRCLQQMLCQGAPAGRVPVSPGRLARRRLDRAIAYMHAHLHERVRLDDIAAAAGLSTYYFSRVFRNTAGISPYRFLVNCRVEKVRELLCNDEKSLAAIAAEAGFADQSHMSNVFRKCTGVTPKAFRIRILASAVTPSH